MALINDLQRQKRLLARCPCCGETIRVSAAQLFDATAALPARAIEHLKQIERELMERRADLSRQRRLASETAAITTEAVNIGKTVERIAPVLPGFPAVPGDCRSMLDPIDYVIFDGLARTGKVQKVQFVDVKTGAARLTIAQRQVREVVQAGRVSLVIEEAEKETKKTEAEVTP